MEFSQKLGISCQSRCDCQFIMPFFIATLCTVAKLGDSMSRGYISLTLLKRIEMLQNNAVKLITFSNYRAHASPLYKYLSILKFSDIVRRQNVLLLHNIYNSIIPPDILDTFNIDFSHFYNTRSSSRGLINSVTKNSTTYGIANLRNQCIASWNKCQILIPKTQFFEMTGPRLKEVLTSGLISNYQALTLFCLVFL